MGPIHLECLQSCWNSVKGEGRIAIGLTYTRTGSRWTWEKLGVTSSSLLKGQDAIAVRCIQESVRATSFPAEAEDQARDKLGMKAAVKYVVNWSFPVPLPTNATTALAKRAGGTGGEAAACWSCGSNSQGGFCERNPAGWPGCVESDGGDLGSGCFCLGQPCAAGGYAGFGGSILMR